MTPPHAAPVPADVAPHPQLDQFPCPPLPLPLAAEPADPPVALPVDPVEPPVALPVELPQSSSSCRWSRWRSQLNSRSSLPRTLAYMRRRGLPEATLAALERAGQREFADAAAFTAHLEALGLADRAVTPDPIALATEGAVWGAIRHLGLMEGTVVVSDGAGQFRVGDHAACWIHAERLVHKLIPVNDIQRRAVEVARQLIWWFYADLKAYRTAPHPKRAGAMRARFDRIFSRVTGFTLLDQLLRRLHKQKADLLRVLARPEIPLHTNGSQNDIRAVVTKRKVSGGTVSEAGRQARDVLLGLMKTCRKLGVSFFEYLGCHPRRPRQAAYPPARTPRPRRSTLSARRSAPLTPSAA